VAMMMMAVGDPTERDDLALRVRLDPALQLHHRPGLHPHTRGEESLGVHVMNVVAVRVI
jgi:hypothetical protein